MSNYLDEFDIDYDFELRILQITGTQTDSILWAGSGSMEYPVMDQKYLDFENDYRITNEELNENYSLMVQMYIPQSKISNIINQVANKDLRTPIYLSHPNYDGWYWIEEIKGYDFETTKCQVKLIKTRKDARL